MASKLPLYRFPGFYEPFSAISHLFGALIFIYLGALLLRRGRGDRSRMIFLGIYAASCVLLFSMSGVYHMMVRGGIAHQVMARLDHGAIFILIAGTFTPAHGLLFRGWRRWGILTLIWGLAIIGITVKSVFFDSLPEWLGLSLYLGLGWIGSISLVMLVRRFGIRFVRPLIWGALFYTLGAILEYLRWRVVFPRVLHSHELFHIAVLMGALCHWFFVWQFADGSYDPRQAMGQ